MRKELQESQRLLIGEMRRRVQQTISIAQNEQNLFQQTLNLIAQELGIPLEEKWTLDKEDKFFEKAEEKKEPVLVTPKRRKEN